MNSDVIMINAYPPMKLKRCQSMASCQGNNTYNDTLTSDAGISSYCRAQYPRNQVWKTVKHSKIMRPPMKLSQNIAWWFPPRPLK